MCVCVAGGVANWDPGSHRTDAPATESLTDTSERAAVRHLRPSKQRCSLSSNLPHLVPTVHAPLGSGYGQTTTRTAAPRESAAPPGAGRSASGLDRCCAGQLTRLPASTSGPTTQSALNPAAMRVVLHGHYVTFFSFRPKGFSWQ